MGIYSWPFSVSSYVPIAKSSRHGHILMAILCKQLRHHSKNQADMGTYSWPFYVSSYVTIAKSSRHGHILLAISVSSYVTIANYSRHGHILLAIFCKELLHQSKIKAQITRRNSLLVVQSKRSLLVVGCLDYEVFLIGDG